jgi:hypothetical protein
MKEGYKIKFWKDWECSKKISLYAMPNLLSNIIVNLIALSPTNGHFKKIL